MKRILILLEDADFEEINKVKEYNEHTWEQVLFAYADAYKEENGGGMKNGENNNK